MDKVDYDSCTIGNAKDCETKLKGATVAIVTATWCPACDSVKSEIAKMSTENNVKPFLSYDADKLQDVLPNELIKEVKALPAIITCKNGDDYKSCQIDFGVGKVKDGLKKN